MTARYVTLAPSIGTALTDSTRNAALTAPAIPVKLDTTAPPTAKVKHTAALRARVRFLERQTFLLQYLRQADTVGCAAQYSLSVSLIRQTATPTPSETPLKSSVAAETPVSTSALRVSSADSTSTRTTAAGAGTTNRASTAATSAPSQATGGAGKVAGAGAVVFVGALGFAGLL